jgi:hypothetical protein
MIKFSEHCVPGINRVGFYPSRQHCLRAQPLHVQPYLHRARNSRQRAPKFTCPDLLLRRLLPPQLRVELLRGVPIFGCAKLLLRRVLPPQLGRGVFLVGRKPESPLPPRLDDEPPVRFPPNVPMAVRGTERRLLPLAMLSPLVGLT